MTLRRIRPDTLRRHGVTLACVLALLGVVLSWLPQVWDQGWAVLPAVLVAGLLLVILVLQAGVERNDSADRSAEIAALAAERDDLRAVVSITAHDLHEPLRKIQSFGERLGEEMGLTADPKARQYLERMTSAATRLRDLLDALSEYVRIEDARTHHQSVALDALVAEVIDGLDEADRRAIHVEGLPEIEVDPGQMTILFTHLLDNALKYRRPDANVDIQISARIETGPGGEHAVIDVADNGIGFDNRHSERIFGLLDRLHARDAYPGAGVGLATCRKIVMRHGGSIHARGEAGQGACFTLILPLRQAYLSR
jgi:signal transduction histidine kinase